MKHTAKKYTINEADRIKIGDAYSQIPMWRQILGIPLIYIPVIVSVPFVILGVLFVKAHLWFLGAKNLKKYKDFIPHRKSYRYAYRDQIVRSSPWWSAWAKTKIFWFYNCGIYCPFSIAMYDYCSYMVKVVENWWCPFKHDRKDQYANAPLDNSFWHMSEKEKKKLHKEDQDNPIYTKHSKKN
tara:strand:- start:5 stop:553 length:549 start_codon:yes stop_codon:yes gene_type:complete